MANEGTLPQKRKVSRFAGSFDLDNLGPEEQERCKRGIEARALGDISNGAAFNNARPQAYDDQIMKVEKP